MPKKYNRTVLVQISDLHGGHVLGLCNPDTPLHEIRENGEVVISNPRLTASQEYLWELYTETLIPEAVRFAGGDPMVLFVTGDISQGNKYQRQLISSDITQQIYVAEYNIHPWFYYKPLKAVRFGIGTPSHVFGEGASEKLVSSTLKHKHPKVDTKTVYHGLANVSGIDIDYAHHGPFHGSRNWLKGNEARYYLRSIMMDEIQAGGKPPNLVMRGHYHTFVKEYLAITNASHEYESWIVIAPSMCMLDDYGHQATRSVYRITNGIVMYEIIDGRLMTPIKVAKTMDIRTKEKLL